MRRFPLLIGLAATLLAPVTLRADDTVRAGDLVIEKAWTRQAPPRAEVGGGYLTIINAGDEADRLIGAAAPFANRVEIHEMAVTDGVMRMAPIRNGLEIPSGATIELKPGGYHLMFMGLTANPRRGERVPVTLTFEHAGTVTLDVSVLGIGAKGPADAASRSGVDHAQPKGD